MRGKRARLAHLVHRVREEGLQAAPLADGLRLEPLQHAGERRVALALGEHLQAVVVVAHVLLVDAQHRQQHVEQVAEHERRPRLQPRREPLEEDLVQEQHRLGVEEDRVDVLVRERRPLGAGGHLERPQEARDEHLQLLHVLLLGLDHAEHEAVALPHALRVRRVDVLLDDLLPPAPAQPAAEEALHFLDFPQLGGVLNLRAQIANRRVLVLAVVAVVRVVRGVAEAAALHRADADAADAAAEASAAADGAQTNRRPVRVFASQAAYLTVDKIKPKIRVKLSILIDANETAKSEREKRTFSVASVERGGFTSARSFFISDDNSSHCCVYCHLAVFSLSTTCNKCTCFCSSSSFCSSNLLKLEN